VASVPTEEGESPSNLQILFNGTCGRCPRCGKGRLFDGFLQVAERCGVCGLDFSGHDAGDAPALAGIFILGFGITGLAWGLEWWLAPPLWVHAVLWIPLTVIGAVVLLKPLKGLTIAIQYRVRSVEEAGRPGGT
jgi:uncharacterized protein (DUF983 family)